MRTIQSASLAVILGLSAVAATAPTASYAQVGISINVGFPPPPLPIYDQPPIPDYGYIWTPGYWAWDADYQDYYWVPGTWVRPPRVGYLWTPGYWGWNNGLYLFNAGYWGTQVGFYGGVNYGYGYGGYGYGGGEWRGGQLYYNRTVNNIGNVHINTIYNRPVAVAYGGRASFNGGAGGVQARPTQSQLAAARGPHVAATPQQRQQIQVARGNPNLRASVNHGAPPIAATAKPGALSGPGVVRASPASATYRPPAGMGRSAAANAGRPGQPGPQQRPANPNQARPEQRPANPNQAGPQQRPYNPNQARPEQRLANPNQAGPQQRPSNSEPTASRAAPGPPDPGTSRTAAAPQSGASRASSWRRWIRRPAAGTPSRRWRPASGASRASPRRWRLRRAAARTPSRRRWPTPGASSGRWPRGPASGTSARRSAAGRASGSPGKAGARKKA